METGMFHFLIPGGSTFRAKYRALQLVGQEQQGRVRGGEVRGFQLCR
jgi:hypothetical protein